MRLSRLCLVLPAAALALAACSEPAPPPAPSPTPRTAQDRAQRYLDCWNAFNNKAWDQFQTCYGDSAVSENVDDMPPTTTGAAAIIARGPEEAKAFPDRRGEVRLVLVNGDNVASIALYTATNTGEMPGPDGKPIPATNKPIGLLIAHTGQFDSTATFVVKDAAYIEQGTIMGQLGLSPAPVRPVETPTGAAPRIVLAKNDATESANVAATRTMLELVNKHDAKAMAAALPDDYKFTEIAQPKDMDKKATAANMEEFLRAFPDLKMTESSLWAAGDYVVLAGTFEGTNTGDIPSMKLKKTGKKVTSRFLEIFRLENGQFKEDWLFYNGAAFAAQLGLK
jgi:predicted ester cyclase